MRKSLDVRSQSIDGEPLSDYTRKQLTIAKFEGADRIYGYPVKQHKPGEPLFALEARDGSGKIYFHRKFREKPYLAAVQHWMQSSARKGARVV